MIHTVVALLARAWIEIWRGGRTIGCLGVALLARAWIEISASTKVYTGQRVALLARAWIEMFCYCTK